MSMTLPPRRSDEIRTHAMDRARERYGIELTFADICDMQRRCDQGEGLTETRQNGVQHHTLIQTERVLWVIYKPAPLSGRRYGVILTIMPPTVATANGKRDLAFKTRRLGYSSNQRDKRKAWHR